MVLIKQNEETNSTELWLDGEFHASWDLIEIPDESKGIIEAMIDYGIEHGQYLKAKEIRHAIEAK